MTACKPYLHDNMTSPGLVAEQFALNAGKAKGVHAQGTLE